MERIHNTKQQASEYAQKSAAMVDVAQSGPSPLAAGGGAMKSTRRRSGHHDGTVSQRLRVESPPHAANEKRYLKDVEDPTPPLGRLGHLCGVYAAVHQLPTCQRKDKNHWRRP